MSDNLLAVAIHAARTVGTRRLTRVQLIQLSEAYIARLDAEQKQADENARDIAEDLLVEPYWRQGTLHYSHVVRSDSDGSPVEILLTPPIAGSGESWGVSLLQDESDHVALTCQEFRKMFQLRKLIEALESM